MPTYNESHGIKSFLTEIVDSFRGYNLKIVVVDDQSSDETLQILKNFPDAGFLEPMQNHTNLGHGASTLNALRRSLELGADYVVATDGDGHVLADDLAKLLETLVSRSLDVVEGIRSRTEDPWFRKLVTSLTRMIVKDASGQSPKDANTPFRAYRAEVLRNLLGAIPDESPVPNLLISGLSRASNLRFAEIPLEGFTRPSSNPTGSTWQQVISWLPSKRFVRFCLHAFSAWVRDRKIIRRIRFK
jgi:glycosyltransferase involved in cell wall biosynthesis